ncbi:hypothetical protein [Niallia sp. 03133]|uniref:hypothetical protein n=1 Tax=Niallia sp. 03133 TaxID=3458060 RepID=UPI004043A8A2
MDPFNLKSNLTELDLEKIEEESFGIEHEELLEDEVMLNFLFILFRPCLCTTI